MYFDILYLSDYWLLKVILQHIHNNQCYWAEAKNGIVQVDSKYKITLSSMFLIYELLLYQVDLRLQVVEALDLVILHLLEFFLIYF